MRVFGQAAFVLHRYEYGETSLVLECLTPEYGRIGILAKGARQPRSRHHPVTPFAPLLIGWSGRGELPLLTHAEPDGSPLALAGRSLWCGFYVNELVIALLHRHDAHPAVFHAYVRVLEHIASGGREDCGLRLFELALLSEVGYGLMLDSDADSGAALEPDRVYGYSFDSGPRRAPASGADVVPVHGRTLLALKSGCLTDEEARREARILLTRAIGRQLRDPLKTPEVFRKMSRYGAAQA
ncbi:MAG: DNA repair protein RecO [Acidiferrobacteraceae bacterium]